MTPLDTLKAIGIGLLALALNLAASVPVIVGWRYLVIPGRPEAAYSDLSKQVAPWSSHILGPVIFFALIWFLSRRKPSRNAWEFATVAWIGYTIIDVTTAVMVTELDALLSPVLLLSLSAKLGAALAGAWLATASRPRQDVQQARSTGR